MIGSLVTPETSHSTLPAVLAGVIVIIAVMMAVWMHVYLRRKHPRQDPRRVTKTSSLRDSTRNAEALHMLRQQGPCFHIVVREDESAPSTNMKFRWEVWEAHRKVWMLLRGTEEDSQIGIDLPYSLGNAPTETEAHAAALEWVLAHPRATRYPIADGGAVL